MTSLKSFKIGIIGAGSMGGAVISALSKKIDSKNITVCETDSAKISSLPSGVLIEKSLKNISLKCDFIIIAVKPGDVFSILDELKDNGSSVVVSIAAGLSIASIESRVGHGRQVIRVMPNTPVSVGSGMSVLCYNENASEESVDIVTEIFRSAGRAMVLPEKMMDAVTGLSGSGPAFVFTFIQAMADAGVQSGLPRKEALELAAQTVAGAAQLVLQSGENPVSLRDRVASPAGTTIEGIHVLERAGFGGIVIDAVRAAVNKSLELSRS